MIVLDKFLGIILDILEKLKWRRRYSIFFLDFIDLKVIVLEINRIYFYFNCLKFRDGILEILFNLFIL